MALNQQKLDQFLEKFVLDFGAVMHAATIVVGDKLGLYKGLAEQPLTAEVITTTRRLDRVVCAWGVVPNLNFAVNRRPMSTVAGPHLQVARFTSKCPTLRISEEMTLGFVRSLKSRGTGQIA
jgi:hypothetical protein